MALIDLGEVSLGSQPSQTNSGKNEHAHPHSTERIPTKQGREPVGVNGHDPVP